MEDVPALVIGGGPAGLMAAEALTDAGHDVTLMDAKPSVGRKFLMAGKSGLNLTKDEDSSIFITRYTDGADWLAPMIRAFGPQDVRAWADELGADTFAGSSGRVFPKAMKASPLLRAWLARLNRRGLSVRTNWRWVGHSGGVFAFETPDGRCEVRPRVAVLSLGGASWPRLGSDGAWQDILVQSGVRTMPFKPSNVGFGVEWSEHMARHFGAAVKPVVLLAGGQRIQGEFVISSRGVEGGGIYAVSHHLREGAGLALDLVPGRTRDDVEARLARPRGKLSISNHLRRVLGLSAVKIALLRECAPEALASPRGNGHGPQGASAADHWPTFHRRGHFNRGGVARASFDDDLMLRALPGVFCAGEMLDWDAPTGGYLLTACLATGRWAGAAAARYLA